MSLLGGGARRRLGEVAPKRVRASEATTATTRRSLARAMTRGYPHFIGGLALEELEAQTLSLLLPSPARQSQ
jgi:hypothetical protein